MHVVTEVPQALLADLGKARRIDQLLGAIEEHDHYTGGHSCRVSALSSMIGRLMGLDDSTVERIKAAGLVHDIGKIHVPRDVLRKTGRLDAEEQAQMMMHPITGAAMLSGIPGLAELAPIVLHHHERWDGRGYPTGVSGIDIPLEARILFVADAFDAMTTVRSYGEAVATKVAIHELERCAGWQFDPLVARTMRIAFEKRWLEPNGIDEDAAVPIGRVLKSA